MESPNFLLKLSKSFITNDVKKLINEDLNPMLNEVINQLNQSIQQYLIYNSNNLINTNSFDLRKSAIVDAISYLLNKVLAPETGKLSINSLFERFTENTNVFNLYNFLESFGISKKNSSISNVENVGKFSFNLNSLLLTGLNTFSDFSFLSPKNGYTFDNSLIVKDIEINVSFDFSILLSGSTADFNGYSLMQSNTVSIVLNNTEASCQIQAVSPIGAGRDYTNSQCIDIDCIGSLFTNETKVNSFGVNLSLSSFNIDTEIFNQTDEENQTEILEKKVYTFAINLTQIILKEYYDTIMLYLSVFSIPAINENIKTSLSNISCKYIPDEKYNDFGQL